MKTLWKITWKILSFLAAPFILLFMVAAPFLGVHFCPQEAIPLLGGAAMLPFLGPLVKRARAKHHCCEPEHKKAEWKKVDAELRSYAQDVQVIRKGSCHCEHTHKE